MAISICKCHEEKICSVIELLYYYLNIQKFCLVKMFLFINVFLCINWAFTGESSTHMQGTVFFIGACCLKALMYMCVSAPVSATSHGNSEGISRRNLFKDLSSVC